MAVQHQIDYGAKVGVPWGLSESAYSAVDRHGTYQYKAFGVPGLGLKRGLGDELVIAPYATALAAMLVPAQSAKNLRRLAALGLEGDYGFFDALDYMNRVGDDADGVADTAQPVIVRTFMAHHQGMTLVALANALLDNRMVSRFHLDSRVRATELLLQERRPRVVPPRQSPLVDEVRVIAPPPAQVRRYRTPHTIFPHAQFLSNGRFVSVVTNAGGGSLMRGRIGRHSIAARCHARSRQSVPLPARRLERRHLVAHLPSDGGRARRLPRHAFVPIGRRSAAATAPSPASSTSPSRPRTTSRSAGSRSAIAARAPARST